MGFKEWLLSSCDNPRISGQWGLLHISVWKELICFGCIYLYVALEICVLDIADDPLYFFANNEAHEILSVSHPLYLSLYIIFIVIYVNSFYLINDYKYVKEKFKK